MSRARLVGALVAFSVLVCGLVACGPGTAPVGQAPMAILTDQTLETVRQGFNQAADRPRVFLLLSPT